MRDVMLELKQLRLHGMAGAWADLVEQGSSAGLDSARWLIENLLQAEGVDRAMRSISHQMHAAKFPMHRPCLSPTSSSTSSSSCSEVLRLGSMPTSAPLRVQMCKAGIGRHP